MKWCAKRPRVQLRMLGVSSCMRKQAACRHGGRRPESRLHHPFTGVVKERLWRVGLLRQRRRKAAGSGLLAACVSIRWMGRRSKGRRRWPGARWQHPACGSALDGWCRFEGAHRRQWTSEVGGTRGEGSPSGNNARRVSVANIERCASNGSSSSVTRARVWSMEPAVTLVHGEAGHASRTVVPKLAGLTTRPILPDPRDANHAWVCVKDIAANR